MIKDNRNNEQIYGRNDMVMLNPNNKIYGSLGIADKYVMKTEEGTGLVLNNPKLGSFGDVLTEFNIYGRSEQKQYKGINLIPPNIKYQDFVEVSIPKGTKVFAITDGTTTMRGNFHFFSVDKTEDMWFGIDEGSIIVTTTLKIDVKYVQYLISPVYDASKICLSIGNEPIYEPYVGGKPSPSPDYPQEIKSVVNPIVKVSSEDGLKVQSVTLNNITLNAIPVSSGGNVTIDGQQYIADYVDVERGKLVKRVCEYVFSGSDRWFVATDGAQYMAWKTFEKPGIIGSINDKKCLCTCLIANVLGLTRAGENYISTQFFDDTCRIWVSANVETNKLTGEKVFLALMTQEEIPLTQEEIRVFKELVTYYPVTIVENNYNTWMKATYKSIESV